MEWFSHYLVMRRVATETNLIEIYINLLDKIDCPELYKITINTTYYFVKVLVSFSADMYTHHERAMLKNLGTWLGQLTIKRNKPILHKHIDVKQALISAFGDGKLTAMLPFICRLLTDCQRSIVFAPPNPWTVSILEVCKAIHS